MRIGRCAGKNIEVIAAIVWAQGGISGDLGDTGWTYTYDRPQKNNPKRKIQWSMVESRNDLQKCKNKSMYSFHTMDGKIWLTNASKPNALAGNHVSVSRGHAYVNEHAPKWKTETWSGRLAWSRVLRRAHERQLAICGHQQGFGWHPKPACQCG
jgi:hypothetical protein